MTRPGNLYVTLVYIIDVASYGALILWTGFLKFIIISNITSAFPECTGPGGTLYLYKHFWLVRT